MACEVNFSVQLKQNLKSHILSSICRKQFWGELFTTLWIWIFCYWNRCPHCILVFSNDII